jgi:predicted phage-related endonuclease
MALEIGSGELAARSTFLLGLSPEDVQARRTCLGGSDAVTIVGADPERVMKLWRFKVGLEEPEDLSDVLAVQMGTWTESFNLMWYAKQTGRSVTGKGRKARHPKYEHLGVTLDGETVLEDGRACVIDAKHVNPFSFDMEAQLAKYAPQLALQMACTGAQAAMLSVFIGSGKWEASRVVDRDPFYEAAVIAALNTFWSHVQTRTPPVEIEPIEAPTPVSLMRRVDLSNSNSWIAAEEDYLASEAHAKKHDDAAKTMKGMLDADVAEAKGRRLVARRDKRGAIRFSKVAAPAANGKW